MFGYLIPRNYMNAMQFDSENKTSKWYDAIKIEMESMLKYKVFKKWDKAILDEHKKVINPPKGYHRIKVHLVFAVKFDGRHKARLVADGHLTVETIENIYSGVVSLRQVKGVTRGGIPISVTSYLRGHLFMWLSLTCFYLPLLLAFNHNI